MRNLKFLMFILIGMISFTAVAIPKQFEKTKHKTEFVKTQFLEMPTVQSNNFFLFSNQEMLFQGNTYNIFYKGKNVDPVKNFAVIVNCDCSVEKNSHFLIYKERLKTKHLLDYRKELSKLGLKFTNHKC